MEEKLSVCIPTYNRKEELLRTLKDLEKQENQNFNVLIVDNNGNYSIRNEVLSHLNEYFVKRITLIERKTNIGGDANILSLFSLCTTDWGWLLGDDDLVQENAINTILGNINDNLDVDCFWYTLSSCSEKKVKLNNLRDFVYENEKINYKGDTIYLSNKIYNIKKIQDYLVTANRFLYTCIVQDIPMFELLKNNKNIMIVSGKPIVQHPGFENGITWNVERVCLGITSLIEYPSELDIKMHYRFVKSIVFDSKFIFTQYFNRMNYGWNYRFYLKSLYGRCYRFILPLGKRIFFYLVSLFGSTKIGYGIISLFIRIINSGMQKLNKTKIGHYIFHNGYRILKKIISMLKK